MTNMVLAVQVTTFVVLGILFLNLHQWRLGVVQLLLAVIQATLYSGRMS